MIHAPKIRRFDRGDLRHKFASVSWQSKGRVCTVVGNLVEAMLPGATLGMVTGIEIRGGTERVLAEVVGFRDDRVLLLPYSAMEGVASGCAVAGNANLGHLRIPTQLLGRVVDPFLRPLTGDPLPTSETGPIIAVDQAAPNPMERARIARPLSLGIRAIDGMLTFGEGQRVAIMAGSGVGKSFLLGMIARGTTADVNIIALIGERGREVREFIERDLGPDGLKRSIVVVVTSDQSPLMRIRGAKVATALAEHFSRLGQRVLLMMDSLTRVATAQREIGLAAGEPPTTKGYPPSLFTLLPRLLERCGPQAGAHGSISGLYTVLVDGDDFNDPLPDTVRSILDGHINLSRTLAARGHFPAIEITTSASRVMYDIVNQEHWHAAQRLRALLSSYQENYDYVQIGTYESGRNPMLDRALRDMPRIEAFLRQEFREQNSFTDTVSMMKQLAA